MVHTKMLIDGAQLDAVSGGVLEILNPATGDVVATVPRATAADVDVAVEAAARAQPAWTRLPAAERARQLLAVAGRLAEESETLARLMSTENGNALRTQSRPEASLAAEAFRYFAGAARELKGESTYLQSTTVDYTRRVPFGVVGAVVPWNSPIALSVQKIAPAIAAGNAIVLKASEEAPLAVLHLAKVVNEILPAGVVNVITGTGTEAGAPLVAHRLVRKISFTGSVGVGTSIMAAASTRVAAVTLELGGKSAQIVLPDVDVDEIVDGVAMAMRVTRQGQSCSAGTRIFVHASIVDRFVHALTERLSRFVVGDPLDEATDIGCIVNERQLRRIERLVTTAATTYPGTLVTGGATAEVEDRPDGLFYRPTVFLGLPGDAELVRAEVFGPVVSVSTWEDEDDVLARANDTEYGLAGFVWGRDIGAALRIAHGLNSGFVWVNQATGQQFGHSYGGTKQSGLGREGSLEGMLDSYTERQQISIRL